jgi:hypothetical protein
MTEAQRIDRNIWIFIVLTAAFLFVSGKVQAQEPDRGMMCNNLVQTLQILHQLKKTYPDERMIEPQFAPDMPESRKQVVFDALHMVYAGATDESIHQWCMGKAGGPEPFRDVEKARRWTDMTEAK